MDTHKISLCKISFLFKMFHYAFNFAFQLLIEKLEKSKGMSGEDKMKIMKVRKI